MAHNLSQEMALLPNNECFTVIIDYAQKNTDFRKMVFSAGQQAAWAASGAGIGGVVGGPLGALIGGTVGGVIGYVTVDNYKNVSQLARKMSDEQKAAFVNSILVLGAGGTMIQFYEWYKESDNKTIFMQTLIAASVAAAAMPLNA